MIIINPQNVVRDLALLRRMAKAGWITLFKEPISPWGARPSLPRYVDDGPKLEGRMDFTYAGRKYRLEYFSGCFYPFVVAQPLLPPPRETALPAAAAAPMNPQTSTDENHALH
jgi:hypothetical protein